VPSAEPCSKTVSINGAALVASVLMCLLAFASSSWAWQSGELANRPIDLSGKPIPPDYSKLSEHNVEWLKTQPAQVQIEFLPGRPSITIVALLA
jgi:hypothetical protein